MNEIVAEHSPATGLARALSKLGFCSRAQAGLLIRAGKVRVNGVVRRDPETPVRLGKDRVDIDGKSIAAAKKIYLALNKPRGIVTRLLMKKGATRSTRFSALSFPGLHPSDGSTRPAKAYFW